MIVASIQITGTDVYVPYKTTITSGMVGVQVQLDYMDPLWDGLHKTVVFYGATVKAIITDDTIVTVPAEVLAKPNYTFSVGVFGWDDTGLVIPTLVADIDSVRPGTNPSGDNSTNKALPVWAQLKAMIGNLNDLDTTAKNNLVAAINEVLTKGSAVDEVEIQRIVDAYLEANPPSGGLDITDDNDGNVVIFASGGVTVSDDGYGNITIA